MNDVDDQYDEAAASFIRAAHAKKQQWFFYFASHHTHVPQFGGIAETGYTLRGLQGDSLSLLDRSVGRITALLDWEWGGAKPAHCEWFKSGLYPDTGPAPPLWGWPVWR